MKNDISSRGIAYQPKPEGETAAEFARKHNLGSDFWNGEKPEKNFIKNDTYKHESLDD